MRELPRAFHNVVEEVWILVPTLSTGPAGRRLGTWARLWISVTGLLPLLATTAALAAPVPAGLPQLPTRGVAVSDPGGVTFFDLGGKRLARLVGYRFVPEYVLNSGLPRLRDPVGRRWQLDVQRHRLVRAESGLRLPGGAIVRLTRRAWEIRRGGRLLMRMRPGQEFPFFDEDRSVVSTVRRALDLRTGRRLRLPTGCILASRRAPHWILLCGREEYGTVLPSSIEELVRGRRHRITGPAYRNPSGPAGFWVYVRVSPDGRSLLAQWSGECESPTAFLIARADGKLRPVGARTKASAAESSAVGWTGDGRPVVHFTAGVCGFGFHLGPGIYSLERDGTADLIARMKPRQGFASWD